MVDVSLFLARPGLITKSFSSQVWAKNKGILAWMKGYKKSKPGMEVL